MNSLLLARKAKKSLKILRKRYHIAINFQQDIFDEWLKDNFYLLERETLCSVKSLKKQKISIDKIYSLCLLFVRKKQENLLEVLREKGEYFDGELLEILPDVLRAVCIIQCEENKKLLPYSIKCFRFLTEPFCRDIVESFCIVDKIFEQDKIFKEMDVATQCYYRARCIKMAKEKGLSQRDFAQKILDEAQKSGCHIGHILLEDSQSDFLLKIKGGALLTLRMVLPLFFSLGLCLIINNLWLFPALYVAFHEILRPVIHRIFSVGTKPRFVPRMELKNDLPSSAKTLITVSGLVPSTKDVDKLCNHLEQLHFSNPQKEVGICFLADLKESSVPFLPSDRAEISALMRGIEQLNKKHPDKFFLCVRPRVYIKTQNAYAGYERKRGAIMQLCELICEKQNRFSHTLGDLTELSKVKYIYALDSDTVLGQNGVVEMASAALHPLNRPIIQNKVVQKGYGIFVPHLSVGLEESEKTLFGFILNGRGGNSAYNSPCSNLYFDLLGLSVFSGKGYFDISTFYNLLKDAFPKERVLSHDILEGGFLRPAFCSFTEVTDGCPKNSDGWYNRLGRWIRGDFQNSLWIKNRIQTKKGTTTNSLPLSVRVFLWDNIVKQITPFVALLLLTFSPLSDKCSLLIGATALLSMTAGEILSFVELTLKRGASALTNRYHSGLLPDALRDILRGIFSLIMLVNTAIVSGRSAFLGLYRQYISRKNLLSWTTAADADSIAKGTLLSYISAGYYGISLGVILTAFTPIPYKIIGMGFMVCPFILFLCSKQRRQERVHLTEEEREKICRYVVLMWNYYDKTCNKANNYLPPDNLSVAPACQTAKRTSPTNIGLYLLSAFCAMKQGIISLEELHFRIEKCLDTLNKLERWKGHFLNWYNTENLSSLTPKYCSAVDSGNLICCLYALKNGIRDLFEFKDVYFRICSILEETDFAHFYNKKQKLFHIGYDLEREELTDGYYDMLMSEARMMVYYAVAKRQVPKEAFANLSRILTSEKGYIGPASWTGTAFEYLMPPLLLPTYKGSLGYEGVKYCIFCGKNRAKKLNRPFGCSESGFYSFDGGLNYQYKAHGIQRLGLKRGLNSEYVVSPYSSFLALPFCPDYALSNLERLKKCGAFGQYGFYEAVDYTKNRRGSAPYGVVQSYMAHHLGMSICGAYNALTNFELCQLFMRDEMLGAKELLLEKIPYGAKIYRHFVEHPQQNKSARINLPSEKIENITPVNPSSHLLSNGNMSLIILDNGSSLNTCLGKKLYRGFGDILRNPLGVFAIATVGKKRFSITPCLQDKMPRQVQFSSGFASFFCKEGGTEWGMGVYLHPEFPCEIRKVRIKNTLTKAQSVRLMFYLEPQLSSEREFSSHPAFNRLFISSGYDEDNKILLFERIERDTGEVSSVLGVGLDRDFDFEFDTRRETVIRRGQFPHSLLKEIKLSYGSNGVPDPCLAMRLKMRLNPKSTREVGLIICGGADKQSVVNNICYCRREKTEYISGALSPFNPGSLEGRICQRLLPRLYLSLGYKHPQKNDFSIDSLWKIGISGDRPIVTAHIKDEDSARNLKPFFNMYGVLRGCGIEYDLCVIYNQGGDYFDRIHSALLKCAGESNVISYVKDGIYFLEEHLLSKDTKTALEQVSCCGTEGLLSQRQKNHPYESFSLMSAQADDSFSERELLLLNGGHNLCNYDLGSPLLSLDVGDFYEDSFLLKKEPPLPYCNVLATENLGSVVSDNSLGFTFYKNSRENRLTEFFNDTRLDNRGEMLILKLGNRYYDMLRGSRVIYQKNTAIYKGKIGEVKYFIRVWVERDVKMISVSFTNPPKEQCEMAFYCQPVLSDLPLKQGGISSVVKENGIYFYNSLNNFSPTYMGMGCDRPFAVCLDKGAFWQGKWKDNREHQSKDPCGAVITKVGTQEKNDILFILTARDDLSSTSEAINRSVERARDEIKQSHSTFLKDAFPKGSNNAQKFREEKDNILRIDTPHKELDVMFNTWLPIQMEKSRYLARCGFYQSSGGYGFRDQLQDVCGLMLINPAIAKEHILRCCAVQFEEGDVLHWWHDTHCGNCGVRTRCSDDMLWLPYTLFEYIQKTGDKSILKETVPFISGENLKYQEQEKYLCSLQVGESGTVYEHAVRAINKIEYAKNGLLKIGSCDWNDGLSAVGDKGEGSSVWLSQFYTIVARNTAELARIMGDEEFALELEKRAQELLLKVDELCYDGRWYVRAFFDNGEVLGSKDNKEAKIDILPQAFGVLSDMANRERLESSINSCMEHLVDDQNGIIRLFAPPLKNTKAGYISSYPKGIRENGGQYTHGALWLVKALFRMERKEEAYRLLRYINPAYRYLQGEWGQSLKTEPYSIPADLYYGEDYMGRGGWSHYTGAASWYYRIVLEDLLGVKIYGDRVEICPNAPMEWQEFSILLCIRDTTIQVKVENNGTKEKQIVYLDGQNHTLEM